MTAKKYTFPENDGGFDAVFREYRAIFEKQLRTVCDSFCDNGAKYKALYDAASYSLEAGGKRIRPVLAFEMCRVCGGDINDAVPAAVAVEMIHTFSLIHDDLPCMDDDDMRRGRPSCHKAHGEAVALLAGDALSAYAGKYICDSDWTVREITPSEGYLLDTTVHKVGAEPQLYTAASVMGCIAAGADEEKISAARAYAHDVGLAFQIVDDILDVTSTAEELGKPIGSDAQQEKTTSVTLLGLDKARELAKKYTEGAENALSAFENNEFLCRLTDLLLNRKN